jgi:PAS domain S-box-containing protein
MRLFVESVHDYAIYLLDPEGRIVSWNAGAQRLKGYTADEVMGKHVSLFYPEALRRAGIPESELRRAAVEGRAVRNGHRVRKDGSTFEAHVVITALRDKSGVLQGFGKVTRDVSEFETLRRADRTKDDFIAFVSHDLRNPLGVIGMIGALLKTSSDAKTRTAAERIQRAVERMTHLVGDLLDVASISAGQLGVHVTPHDAAQLIREAADAVAPLAAEKGLWVDVKAREATARVRCDGARIHQVLGNLLGNAIKYSRRGTTITVRADAAGDDVRFAVGDSGRGISPEQLAHIFDRFFQSKPKSDGHGLGLYIAKGIVEAHGGRIWAESMVSQGSTFFFTLPAERAGGAPGSRGPA